MKRLAPAYLLAVIVILCAVGLALGATSPEIAAKAAGKPAATTILTSLATPVPAATFHYSTVGSCGCEVKATGTVTPAPTPE